MVVLVVHIEFEISRRIGDAVRERNARNHKRNVHIRLAVAGGVPVVVERGIFGYQIAKHPSDDGVETLVAGIDKFCVVDVLPVVCVEESRLRDHTVYTRFVEVVHKILFVCGEIVFDKPTGFAVGHRERFVRDGHKRTERI